MKKILIGLLALTAWTFVSCDKDDPEEDPIAERTVLVYMAAQNNLNSYAHYDLLEIEEGMKNIGNNHLVVYHDRAMQDPVLLHYRNGELRDSIPMDPAAVVCDPATLKAVAKKAFTDYPPMTTGWYFGAMLQDGSSETTPSPLPMPAREPTAVQTKMGRTMALATRG